MKANNYKLSIVVAIYNLDSYLNKCLDSLVNQTLKEIEILCIDDGSTDNSGKIIDEYEQMYPNIIKAYHKKNGGEYTTRSYGLSKASGEYVAFVDCDDYVRIDWAEKLYNAAKEIDADLSVCAYDRINLDNGKLISRDMTKFGNCQKRILPNDDFIAFINTALWNKIFKLEKVKELQFFHVKGYNDAMFCMMAYTKIEKVVFIKDSLYIYNVRVDSQINNINLQDIEKLKKYLLEVKKMYKLNNKYDSMKELLDLMAFLHLGVAAIYRVSYDNKIDIKKELKEIKKYLDNNFKTWRNNPFLKLTNCYNKGIRHIGLWGISILYRLNLEMIYIKVYRFLIDKLKIDIKF